MTLVFGRINVESIERAVGDEDIFVDKSGYAASFARVLSHGGT
jgi:hypothetical protein